MSYESEEVESEEVESEEVESEEVESEEVEFNDMHAMLGALACSIRGSWREVECRLDTMRQIMDEIGIHYDIDEEEVRYDGRWFRDCWDGPYGNVEKKNYSDEVWDNYYRSPLNGDDAWYDWMEEEQS